jgi:hypothetical protein
MDIYEQCNVLYLGELALSYIRLLLLHFNQVGYSPRVLVDFLYCSTVGLGDVVPTNQDMMFINFILILIGLALLSMCFDMVQKYIEQLLEDILQQFIAEFQKMTAVTDNTKPIEIGITGTLHVCVCMFMNKII